jgi:hypothetical protein
LNANDRLAHAIAERDLPTLEGLLAPDFRFAAADGSAGDRGAWLQGVRAFSYKVLSITNEQLKLDLDGDRAVLCGVQRASLLVERKPLVDETPFCDRWEKRAGRWWLTFAGVP